MKKCSFLFSSFICFTVVPELLLGLPQDPSVVAGDVTIQNHQSRTMVVKASNKAIIDYKSFDIQKGEKVQFIQPSSSSVILNRVKGSKASKILGQMESNGKVVLVNPNGMYFGPHASVKVASLVASTLDISNEDFIKGQYSFLLKNKDFLSEIRNDGLLSASPEGSIVLMAPIIRNFGTIQAKAGKVVLASGERVTLDFHGDGLLQFTVEGDIKGAVVQHLGSIQAEGGEVHMNLPTAKRAIHEIVNKDGIERGEVFVKENGEIFLVSSSSILAQKVSLEASSLFVDGKIDVSSESGKGGEVRLAGAEIFVRGAQIDASGWSGGGDVLIGGEYQGGGSMPYATNVSMDSASHILANAVEEGNGGNIVLWSSEETDFEGNIFAQGGFQGGNGGKVETSSLDNLSIRTGYVNASAPSGAMGEWLLDPGIINVNGSGGANPGCVDTGIHNVDVAVIEAAVATVTLCANEINVNVAIQMTNTNVGLIFTAPSGDTGILNLSGGAIVTIGGLVTVKNMVTLLNVATIIDTTNLGNYPSGGPILIKTIDAGVSGSGIALHSGLGTTIVDDIGVNAPVNNVLIASARQAFLRNIIADNDIISVAPVSLTGDSLFRAGGNIDLSTLDATLLASASITLDAYNNGTISVVGGIGTNDPLGGVLIPRGASGVITGSIFTQNGNIGIVPSIQLAENITIFKTFSELNTLLSGDIVIGDVLPDVGLVRSLDLQTGLKGSVTAGNIGASGDYLSAFSIGTNQPLSIGDIYSANVFIKAGSGIVNLNGDISAPGTGIGVDIAGATVNLGGTITSLSLSIVARNSILNNDAIVGSKLIDVNGDVLLDAKRGNIGTSTSPLDVQATGTFIAGGQNVYLTADSSPYEPLPNNQPCSISFGGRRLLCSLANRRTIFLSLPKSLLRNLFFNSLNLGIGYPIPTSYGQIQNSSFAPIDVSSDWQLPTRTPFDFF